MHKTIVGLLLLLSISFTAHADLKRDIVLEVLKVTESKKNHELMVQAYIQNLTKNPALNTEEFKAYMIEASSWESVMEPMISVYTDIYTEAELQAIIDFYGSDVGYSINKKTPEVNQKFVEIMTESIEKAMRHLRAK